MDGTVATDTRNKRQRVDDAQGVLERAHANLATAKARKMRLLADTENAGVVLELAIKAAADAEEGLAEALTRQDPPPSPVTFAPDPRLSGSADDDLTRDGAIEPAETTSV